jgi:hypothetical protein
MTDNEIKENCLQEAGIDLGRYSHTEMTQIKDALRRYHNAKLKLLSIADVSGSLPKLQKGDKIKLYGRITSVEGFRVIWNEAFNDYEIILLTTGRADPFKRSLDVIELISNDR